MNKLALLTAAAVISVPVSSFAQDKLTAAGITVGTLGNPFFVPLIKGAEDGLKEKNPATKVTVVGADYDLNKQASQIDSFIAGGYQVVLINAVDAVAVKPFVEKAKAAGAVVAAMDVSAAGSDLTVMTNNVQAGELACTDLAERLKGKGDVVIINGPPISSIMDRVKGCKQAFSKYPDIKVLSDNQDGKASREGGLLNFAKAKERSDEAVSRLSIRTKSASVNVGSLSGGNQQKALIARILAGKPKVVILDEPTRGVDVGAKSEIYRIIDELAASGIAVVVISSDLPEIIGISDRVLVMQEGRIAGEVCPAPTGGISQEAIMALSTGASVPA